TAAGHETARGAVHEPQQAREIARIVERNVVMHGDVAAVQPSGGAFDPSTRRMQQDEAYGIRRQVIGSAPPERLESGICAEYPDGEHQVGMPQDLLRPGCHLWISDEQNGLALPLELVDGPCRFRRVEVALNAGDTVLRVDDQRS